MFLLTTLKWGPFLVNTITKEELQPVLNFPAVTLCNSNQVHCGNLYERLLQCQDNSKDCDDEFESVRQMFCLGGCDETLAPTSKTCDSVCCCVSNSNWPPAVLIGEAPLWLSCYQNRFLFLFRRVCLSVAICNYSQGFLFLLFLEAYAVFSCLTYTQVDLSYFCRMFTCCLTQILPGLK